jgi:hypothetical protein
LSLVEVSQVRAPQALASSKLREVLGNSDCPRGQEGSENSAFRSAWPRGRRPPALVGENPCFAKYLFVGEAWWILHLCVRQTRLALFYIFFIPASRILVRYRTKKMPDCVSLVQYQTCSGIVSSFQSGTGLTGCRTVALSSISVYVYKDIDMDMDMQYGHGHAAWAWTHRTALVMQHISGQWTCMDAGMLECR